MSRPITSIWRQSSGSKISKDFKGSVVVISHDRFLLDRLADAHRLAQSLADRQLYRQLFGLCRAAELNELQQQRAYELQQKDIAKQEEFIRRFKAGQRSKEAKGRERRLDRLKKAAM